jgi:hypothetical protein
MTRRYKYGDALPRMEWVIYIEYKEFWTNMGITVSFNGR